MAKIVAGFSSSHTPMMSLPGENWGDRGGEDQNRKDLIRPSDGAHVDYEGLLASAAPGITKHLNRETYVKKFENIQNGLNELQKTFEQVNPDVVVMFGDDQNELLYFDNYPSISVYWGEILPHYPRLTSRPDMAGTSAIAAAVYGYEQIDYPVDTKLGLHVIESLMDQEFDVGHSTYLKEEYTGTIGPSTWYLQNQYTTKPHRQGMPHAWSFPVCRWFADKRPPAVPIFMNTCYPPNWISPRRAYALGRAVRQAIADWESDARVAIVTSGGLSHFVVDEEIDRMALKGLEEGNGEILTSLPRYKLQSATTEILNWVAAAGAMGETKMETLCYEPGYRSPAGTGCGCAVGRWIPTNGA